MTTEFDPAKALREELLSLNDIRNMLTRRKSASQQRVAEAEDELNAISKMIGFADAEIERKRKVLAELG